MSHIFCEKRAKPQKVFAYSNSIDLEEGSDSIPKSEPTPLPIAPANPLGELKLKIMHILHTYIY